MLSPLPTRLLEIVTPCRISRRSSRTCAATELPMRRLQMTRRMRGKQPYAALERFLEKVTKDASTGCWIWTGYIDKLGNTKFCPVPRLTYVSATRWIYQLQRGPLPGKAQVLPGCNQPLCVNPDHLVPPAASLPPLERFMQKVSKETGTECWNWTGPLDGRGHGRFYLDRWNGLVLAEKWLYEHERGPLPHNTSLRQRCKNTRCVNIDHLVPHRPIDRFMANVDKDPSTRCWVWKGRIGKSGHGTFYTEQGSISAAVWICQYLGEPIPGRARLRPRCNPLCVNPDHLFPTAHSSPLERFMSKVDKDPASGCWRWKGSKDAFGNATFFSSKRTSAARWIWQHLRGPLSVRVKLRPSCNSLCVNPDHLLPTINSPPAPDARGWWEVTMNEVASDKPSPTRSPRTPVAQKGKKTNPTPPTVASPPRAQFPSPIERFMQHVAIDPESDCWNWNGSVGGYGHAKFSPGTSKHTVPAAKWIYEHKQGRPIPRDGKLRQRCKNRRCVNPDHLRVEQDRQLERLLASYSAPR